MTGEEFFGDSEYISIASQATMTREFRIKVTNPTGSGVDHLLPDATTIPVGQIYYILNIHASNQTDIHDNGDGLVVDVPGGSWAKVWLTDNSTTNGVWESALSVANALKGG